MKCTFLLKKLVYEDLDTTDEEEAKALIAKKYAPLRTQGYFILEDDITFDDTKDV